MRLLDKLHINGKFVDTNDDTPVSLGLPGQVLTVQPDGTGAEWTTPSAGGTVISPKSADTPLAISGVNYAVPTLTADELTQAYNSVIAGTATYITNKNGTSYFTVLQADSIQDVDILIEFFGIATLEYHLEGNRVEITAITQGGGSGNEKELLWQNASPTSNFNPQNIYISLSGYSYIEIEVLGYGSASAYPFIKRFPVTSNSFYFEIGQIANSLIMYREQNSVSITNGFIYFGQAYTREYSSISTASIDGRRCVPLKIYGIK